MEHLFNYYLDDNSGILLVSNRCSYAVGINRAGQKLLIGGWDSRFVDDGSEYYIGLSAIKAAIAEYEMLGGRTNLTEQVKTQLKITTLEELKYILSSKKLSDKKIMKLSNEVLKCAENGDRISQSILNCAAERLFNMIDIIVRRLNMYDCKYNLCLAGGIIKFGEYIIEPLCDKIYNRYDNIEIFTHNNVDKENNLKITRD
jgi:N-acetylglucosamine kinase-like BadF-type ATPase